MVSYKPGHPNLLEVQIRDLSTDGAGIGESDGRVVFVEGALPGEWVEARITAGSRGRLHGELHGIKQESAERRHPPCILANDCGGCSLQHWSDGAQVAWKEQHLQQLLRRIGSLELNVEPILASPQPLGYRNRAIIPIQKGEQGLRAGFYRRGSHSVVNMNHCPVLDPRLDALIEPMKADLAGMDWPIYDETDQSGMLRHLVLRVGANSGELLAGLVARNASLPGAEDLAQQWMERWPQLVGVVLNLQPKPTNTLLGPTEVLLAGRPWLMESFADKRFQIALDTFFQVHTHQAEQLVERLNQVLDLKAGEVLVDGYCGIGTLGLPLTNPEMRLIGIELHPSSIERARCNALLNGMDNAEFKVGSMERSLEEVLPFTDALLLDPPRKGLSERLCDAIAAEPPARIAYVSCNPSTLARDLARLTAKGSLELQSVHPLDFFPQTTHTEAMAVLVRPGAQR